MLDDLYSKFFGFLLQTMLWHNRYHSFPFVLTPVEESLSLFWREIHTKDQRARSFPKPEWTREGRSRENRERQLTTEGRREQSAWDSSSGKDTVGSEKMEVGQRRESTEVKKTTAKTCWSTEAGLTNARRQSRDGSAFLVALWKFRAKYTPAIACKCTESCTKMSHKLPPSCAWS